METIPFAKPFIGKEEEEAVLTALRSGWLTTGKETLAFEKDFSEFLQNRDGLDLPFCMAVNSATSGLHLAMEAVGIGKGDIVLIPSMTFTSTAEVVRYLGAEVVFVDVVKDGYHMDPAALEQTLRKLEKGATPKGSRRAKAVVPVHYGGLPCDMDVIVPIARKYGLKIIEDAAHSFPSFIQDENDSAKGRWAGLSGDVGVFSFYATKTITTGEGGMVVTRDKAIADRVRIMRSHGIDRSVWDRYSNVKASWYYQVIEPGYKYNIPDILSALGRAQLRRAYDLLAMREKIAAVYDKAFHDDRHFLIPPTGNGDARHLYPLRLCPENLSLTRNEFAEKLQERGIGISVHFIPLHTMPYYKKRYSLEDNDLPETLKTFNRTISLPIWPGMTESQIDQVLTTVKSLVQSSFN
jgi:dTDP-4-amino-4,6-dideoxygalactose transaminase